MKVRTWAVFLLAILFMSSVAFSQGWREDIEKALQKKKSYELSGIALIDVLRIISQDAEVNIITDSSAGIDPTAKLSYNVKDMSLADCLSWTARLTGLEWCIQDEAVFISKNERLSMAQRREIEKRNAAYRALAVKTWFPAMQEKLARKWNVIFEEKPLADARESLKVLMGINFVVSSRVEAKTTVDLNVSNMTGESAISWVARKAGLDYAILDEAVYFTTAEDARAIRFAGLDLSSQGRVFEVVSFDFKDTPFDEAIKTLSEKSGVRITLRNPLETAPKVTFSGSDMPLAAALQGIVSRTGLSAAIIPEGDGLIVSVIRPAAPTVTPPQPAQSTDSRLGTSASSPGAAATGN